MQHWYEAIVEMLRDIPLKHRETCPHGIDYEIYDSLPEHLKNKYVNQFKSRNSRMNFLKDKIEFSIICDANRDFDPPNFFKVDCSKHYPKTIKEIKERYKKTRVKKCKKD